MGATTRQQRPSKRRPVMVSPLDPFDPSRPRMSIVRARKLEQLQRVMRARAVADGTSRTPRCHPPARAVVEGGGGVRRRLAWLIE